VGVDDSGEHRWFLGLIRTDAISFENRSLRRLWGLQSAHILIKKVGTIHCYRAVSWESQQHNLFYPLGSADALT
jgi:hypothetical protein